MAYESSIITLSEGDKVRFTAERLSMLAPADRKRLEGRVGVVQGRWNYTRKRTVYFPEDGGRSELRILSVDPSQLERVSIDAAQPEVPPTNVEAPSGDEKLSQEDLDDLFG
ncbi:MAG TPA: hypothetical protein VIM63_16230 [Rhodoferax sp.]